VLLERLSWGAYIDGANHGWAGGLKHADTAAARVCDGAHTGSNLFRIDLGNSKVTWNVQGAICRTGRAFSRVDEVVGGRRGTFRIGVR
jgi:hypothetical protein